jgi:hypothetical protein
MQSSRMQSLTENEKLEMDNKKKETNLKKIEFQVSLLFEVG